MAQKQQTSVTTDRAKNRCPRLLSLWIGKINHIDKMSAKSWADLEKFSPGGAQLLRGECKAVHELAQMAALPTDWRDDYSKAVVGTTEEWDRFCRDLSGCMGFPVKLWRKWPVTIRKQWPTMSIELTIMNDGRINSLENDVRAAMLGVEARRIKECRICQQIFWATRIDMVACGKRCANALRQRTFRESKKP